MTYSYMVSNLGKTSFGSLFISLQSKVIVKGQPYLASLFNDNAHEGMAALKRLQSQIPPPKLCTSSQSNQ